MTIEELVNAIELPLTARIDKRIPKKLLMEQVAVTVADRRLIQESVDELLWLGALKPSTVGIKELKDETHEYLEIAVICAQYKPNSKTPQISKLIHKVIPYPVFLIFQTDKMVGLSLAHKRLSQSDKNRVVLETYRQTSGKALQPEVKQLFLESLSSALRCRTNLFDAYQLWQECLIKLEAAEITGSFIDFEISFSQITLIDETIQRYEKLNQKLITTRSRACKEKQMNRKVALNLELKSIEQELLQVESLLRIAKPEGHRK